jgi:hypothetical protein
LYQYIETSVRNGVFNLSSSRSFQTGGRSPRIHISAPNLNSMIFRGAVDANMYLHAENLTIDVEGAGNVKLSGSAETLTILNTGASNVEAFDFPAQNVTVNLNGAGAVDVHATNNLHVDIDGVGLVRYAGDPLVTRNISGLGFVQQWNN